MHRERVCTAVLWCAVLLVACARPPANDTALILRQRSLATTLEVTVDSTRLDIVVKENTKVLERAIVNISPDKATKIRDLFWNSFRHQPTRGLTPVRDLVFEQEWRGRARSQKVLIQGYPLTSQDRRAYNSVNELLPLQYRFGVDVGPYRRSRSE